jgi:uncharacterized protein HemX
MRMVAKRHRAQNKYKMIDVSTTILVAVILVFVAYYLHESHKKTELKNENTKVINENTALKNKITELETKDAKSQKTILQQEEKITALESRERARASEAFTKPIKHENIEGT